MSFQENVSITKGEPAPPQVILSPQALSRTNPPFASQTHNTENEPFCFYQSYLVHPVCGLPRHCCEELPANQFNGSGRISSPQLVSSWLCHTLYHITNVLVSNICQGKGWGVPLRMAAEVGCSRSSSLTLLPIPQLAELGRGELHDLPCNRILLSGIS